MAKKPVRPKRRLSPRKISARYQLQETDVIDYKNITLLQKFVNERGKLVSRRLSGISAKAQRQMTTAVKRARYLALLPCGSVKH